MRPVVLLLAVAWTACLASAWGQGGSRYNEPAEGSAPPPERSGEFDSRELFDGFDNGGLPSTAPPRTHTNPPDRQGPPAEQPASAAPAVEPPPIGQSPATVDDARELMQAALTPPASSQLGGRAMSLREVIRTASTRREQSERIHAYWDLCSAVADYYLSLHEQAELERLASRVPQLTSPLQSATAQLETRRDTALTAARASQQRLSALMGQGQGDRLPVPGDLPVCSAYRTLYSQDFADGGPAEAAVLNRLLPLRHAELLDAAANVARAETWYEQIVRRAGDAQGAEGVVRGLEFLALNRRAFVQIARDYNRRITRYTELARPGLLRTERLVAMFIKEEAEVASRNAQPDSQGADRRSQASPPATFRDPDAGRSQSTAPHLDSEVLPAVGYDRRGLVEKISPGETSVLRRRTSE